MAQDEETKLQARRREERRAVDEAGGGVAEGFELAEADLIDHASHDDRHADHDHQHSTEQILRDAGTLDEEQTDASYSEADGDVDGERHPDRLPRDA